MKVDNLETVIYYGKHVSLSGKDFGLGIVLLTEVAPAKTRVGFGARTIQRRRHDIEVLNKIAFSADKFAALLYDKRHMGQAGVKVFSMSEIVIVLPHSLAVVRCKNNQRLIVKPLFSQSVYQTLEVFILVSYLGIILRNIVMIVRTVRQFLI